MELWFWISLCFVIYTYLLYPACLWICALFVKKDTPAAATGATPTISIVLAARNEADKIEQRIANLLELEYPAQKYEILVASDGSTDDTAARVERIIAARPEQTPQLHLFALPAPQGKAHAINLLVSHATGELVVFTDSRQSFAPAVLQEFSRAFQNPVTGCVSGELFYRRDAHSRIDEEMNLYWRYEKQIRKLESAAGSLIGATGAIYAIRRQLYRPLAEETILDDVVIPMRTLMQNHQVIFTDGAMAFDTVSNDMQEEWRRKLRTLAGNWQLFSCAPEIFTFGRPLVLWRLLSHKIARLLVPWFLLSLLISACCAGGLLYHTMAAVQCILYSSVLLTHLFPALQRYRLLNVPYFFMVLNIAAGAGLIYYLTGNTQNLWRPQSHRRI